MGPSRRRADGWFPGVLSAVTGRPAGEQQDMVGLGRCLLLLLGLLTTSAAPLLGLGRPAWTTLGLVSLGMAIAFAITMVVPWRRLPQWTLLAFPILVFVAFGVLGWQRPGVFAPLTGFFTLCYGYVGLAQRPRTGLVLVPFSAAALVMVYGRLDGEVTVRLIVATSVWVILSEVLAGFVARQAMMAAVLQSAALQDLLTGVGNRRDLDARLAGATPGTAVVICDLDHFKHLNDTQGHSAGDQVLAAFGRALRLALRGDDYCARFGGEEFVLLLPGTDAEQATAAVSRLRALWQSIQPDVTFSAGIAECRAGRSPAATLAAADHALYAAKTAGRNTDRRESSASVTLAA